MAGSQTASPGIFPVPCLVASEPKGHRDPGGRRHGVGVVLPDSPGQELKGRGRFSPWASAQRVLSARVPSSLVSTAQLGPPLPRGLLLKAPPGSAPCWGTCCPGELGDGGWGSGTHRTLLTNGTRGQAALGPAASDLSAALGHTAGTLTLTAAAEPPEKVAETSQCLKNVCGAAFKVVLGRRLDAPAPVSAPRPPLFLVERMGRRLDGQTQGQHERPPESFCPSLWLL